MKISFKITSSLHCQEAENIADRKPDTEESNTSGRKKENCDSKLPGWMLIHFREKRGPVKTTRVGETLPWKIWIFLLNEKNMDQQTFDPT